MSGDILSCKGCGISKTGLVRPVNPLRNQAFYFPADKFSLTKAHNTEWYPDEAATPKRLTTNNQKANAEYKLLKPEVQKAWSS